MTLFHKLGKSYETRLDGIFFSINVRHRCLSDMKRKSICCRRNERTLWQEGLSGLKTNVQFSRFVIAPNEVLPFITLHWQKSIKVMRTRSLYNFVQMKPPNSGEQTVFPRTEAMHVNAKKVRIRKGSEPLILKRS